MKRSALAFLRRTHDMDVLLDTGPKGTLWGMHAVFPHMRDQGRGRIVTMGSNAALLGAVGYAPYASSKEAIRALTRSATACLAIRLPTAIVHAAQTSPSLEIESPGNFKFPKSLLARSMNFPEATF